MVKSTKKNSSYKVIGYAILLVIAFLGGLFFKQRNSTPIVKEIPKTEAQKALPVISIGTKDIKEENFTGTMPTISGSGILATSAQAYIEQTVDEFKKQADTDVPSMREKFGRDSPMASYTIDIKATQTKSEKTQSIVMSEYTYTGGANGNSLYKVITASRMSGKILSLADIIKNDKQSAFTAFVKKELNAWRPESADASVVFEDEVKNLNFDSFTNWSLDDKDLTLYFDKYQIGPGVLGPVAFPIPLSKIKDFLNLTY